METASTKLGSESAVQPRKEKLSMDGVDTGGRKSTGKKVKW